MPAAASPKPNVQLSEAPWQPLLSGLSPVLRDLLIAVRAETHRDRQKPELPAQAAWLEALNRNFKYRNHNGQPLRFVPQDESLPYPHLAYEARIWQHGLIATRSNWHDFFNALVWHVFPRSKSALNAVHWQEMQAQAGSQRSPRRDALTLFDESGLLVLAEDTADLTDLSGHHWSQLLKARASRWQAGRIQAITFGHALYEKYLDPYVGMTGKALLLRLPSERLQQLHAGHGSAQRLLDEWLAGAMLAGRLLHSGRELAPMPVLGIPGWWANRPENFLQTSHYFRPPGAASGERKIYDLSGDY